MKYVNEMKYDFFFSCILVQTLRSQTTVVNLAFSSKEKNFTSICVHSRHRKCDDCEMLSETQKTIEEAIDTIKFPNSDEKDDAKYVISQVNHIYKIKGYCILML